MTLSYASLALVHFRPVELPLKQMLRLLQEIALELLVSLAKPDMREMMQPIYARCIKLYRNVIGELDRESLAGPVRQSRVRANLSTIYAVSSHGLTFPRGCQPRNASPFQCLTE